MAVSVCAAVGAATASVAAALVLLLALTLWAASEVFGWHDDDDDWRGWN